MRSSVGCTPCWADFLRHDRSCDARANPERDILRPHRLQRYFETKRVMCPPNGWASAALRLDAVIIIGIDAGLLRYGHVGLHAVFGGTLMRITTPPVSAHRT